MLTRDEIAKLLAEATPGPWYSDNLSVSSDYVDPDDDDDDGMGWQLAEVFGPPQHDGPNVLLMAAAPSLAAQLLRALDREARLLAAFLHTHHAGPAGNEDQCSKCGLDIRNPVHRRATPNTAPTEDPDHA